METATQQDVEVAVNRLIEVCREGQQGFRAAATAVPTAELKAELELYSRQRGEFAEALVDALREEGHIPTSYGAIPGVLRRGWMNLSGALGVTAQTVLTACERGEEAAHHTYFEVMNEPLPSTLKTLVIEQFHMVETVHERIRALREAASQPAPAAPEKTQGNGREN